MANHQALYMGRSGHLAVMSELLYHNLNVAMPEMDVGDDVFVVRDGDDTVTRVQVKSANAKEQLGSYMVQFRILLAQLTRPDNPPLVYVFPVRWKGRWSDFVVIRRSTLNRLRVEEGLGSVDPNGYLILRMKLTSTDVMCRNYSLQTYRNA